MTYKNYIKTPNSITLIFDGGNPITIYKSKNTSAYQQIVHAIEISDYDKILELASDGTYIEKKSDGKVKIKNGKATIEGESLPERLSARLIAFLKAKADIAALVNFWKRLRKNPSKQSIEELYGFLETNHVPITPEGNFIAYKSVKDDYMDGYTGTLDNTPGQVVQMSRDKVDPDRYSTCSHGLHVAAFRYAKFSYSGAILLDVLVDPADVVSVPVDYNQEKIRVCKYKVLCVHGAEKEIKKQVAERKVRPVATMKIKTSGNIRVTKSMLSMIPKPKEGDLTPLYVCVQGPGCVAVLRKPYLKPTFCRRYDSTSSVNITNDALTAAGMQDANSFIVSKAKKGIFIKKGK